MRLPLLLATLLIALAFVAAACSDGGNGNGDGMDGSPTPLVLDNEGLQPVAVNSELVLGPNRFGIALLDEENRPIEGAAGTTLSIDFYVGDELKLTADTEFVWAIPDETGFFVANVDFDEAGTWEADGTLTRDGADEPVKRFQFKVEETGRAPTIGKQVPPTENATIGDATDFTQISTDEDPVASFYQMTVAEAIDAGKPFVVIFATPKFCQTRFCGPILDNVKAIAPEYADGVNFIHIEPFELDESGDLIVGDDGFPTPVAAAEEWQLISEPWIFVMDAGGVVQARFEGSASPHELRQVIDPLLG